MSSSVEKAHILPQEWLSPHFRLIAGQKEEARFSRLAGDGSNRVFFRLSGSRGSLICVIPGENSPVSLKESESYQYIGTHLARAGVSVPAIISYEPLTGAILMEDLGDYHLEGFVKTAGIDEIRTMYSAVLEMLILMQTEGVKGFNAAYCFDTRSYDRNLMLERESGYFVRAFLAGYLGMDIEWEEFASEFEFLAEKATAEPATFLLHRDFQSRNILIYEGKPRLIDFQGARFGPLGYDLASLIFDPYVNLSEELRSALFEKYLDLLGRRIPVPHNFRKNFWYLALQRSLQVLGAYGFLTKAKGKSFFEPYIPVAFSNLKDMLEREEFLPFKKLREVANSIKFNKIAKN